jgi:integrase
MKFNLKKYNTSGLSYVDDGQILPTKIKNNEIISTNITFKKPYKIQIRASKMINGRRKQSKKTLTFESTVTLLDAIKESSKVYDKLMVELSNTKFQKQDFSKEMLYKDVFKLYIEYKVAQYEARDDKNEYDKRGTEQFHDKWLKPLLNKPIGMIDEEDIQKIVVNIKKAGLSERTSRKVYQYVNPVFKFFNMKAAKFGVHIASPAKQQDLPPLNNERGLDLSLDEIKELFVELRNYPLTPVREIFMFLMHGRRFNEVVTLKWEDIDFTNSTYTIKALNNKARVDMTYHLSNRLKEALETLGIKDDGYVFTKINNKNEPYSAGSIRNHWKQPIVIHQLRNCIGMYLQNKLGYGIDIVEAILGHKQNKKVTNRYAKINYTTIGKIVDEMLDDMFDEITVVDTKNEKLEKLKVLLPEKSEDELVALLDIMQ